MLKKTVRTLGLTARVLEILVAVTVLAAVLVQLTSIPSLFSVYVLGNDSMRLFHAFLDNILTLVIGLEFFRMLLFSDADAVLEVVLFVLARHLLASGTTAADNLLTVIGIAIVVLVSILLKRFHKKMGDTEEAGGFDSVE